jgi:hypothetical protein
MTNASTPGNSLSSLRANRANIAPSDHVLTVGRQRAM